MIFRILLYFNIISHLCMGASFHNENVEIAYMCIKNSLVSFDNPQYSEKFFHEKSEIARSCLENQLPITLISTSLESGLLEYAKMQGIDGKLKEHEGYGGATIHSIISEDSPQLIIKSYPVSSKQIVMDIWGQMAASAQNLQSIHVPKILDILKIKVIDDEYLLFVQEYVSGEPLWNLFDLGDKNYDSYQTKKNTAIHVLRLLGKGIREYHQKSTWKSGAPSYIIADHLDWISEKGPALLDEHPELAVNGSKVKIILKAYRQSINTRGIDWSYLHGDPHFGNFLYDEKTDILGMFDLGEGATSIDCNFIGMGSPMLDFVKIEEYIISQSSKIGEKDAVELNEAFFEGYGNPPKEETYHYFYIIDTLDMLNWYYNESDRVSEKIRQTMKASLDSRLSKIALELLPVLDFSPQIN